ncbi:MAG: hypothetical protein JST51_09470 [Armatimonadetes bacterium]|nr:hypothetical protein [Armatimonadota bacterium]
MSKVNVPIAFLSLVTSVLLWASVYNNANRRPAPKDISIGLETSNLDRTKYHMVDYPSEITISVAGNTDLLKTVTPYAIVDLSAAQDGVKSYPVAIFPNSIRELLVKSSVTAQVKIESLVTKAMEVKANFNGIVPGGRKVSSIDAYPHRVFVTGPADLVQKVSQVRVDVDYSPTAVTPEGVEVEAQALDTTGTRVPRLVVRTSDSHPEYTDETIQEPAMVRIHLKLEDIEEPKVPIRFP